MKNKRLFLLMISIMLISSLFLFASCWEEEKNPFIVTFNANGGMLVSGQEVQSVKDASEIVPPEYFKEGHEFVGFDKTLSELNEDTTVNAVWRVKAYVITFDADGGQVSESFISVNFGENIPTLPIPEKAGYVFTGWKTKGADGKIISQGSVYSFSKDITVVALWEEITPVVFHITYDMNGAEFLTENPTSYKIDDADITLVNPEKPGYDFLGWKEDKELLPTLTAVIKSGTSGDLHFTAMWQAKTYKLNFNANGGFVSTSYKEITFSTKVGTIPTPEREGYIFKGWRIGGVNGEVLTNELVYTYLEDITVVAVWEEIIIPEYDITYTLNGGELSSQNPIKYKSNDEDITLINPEKTGYTFKGWKLGDEEPKINTVIEKGTSGDLHFTAVWQANKYRLIFDAMGGSVNPSFINVTFDAEIGVLPIPEKQGHAFKGWKEMGENGKIITQGVIYKKTANTTVIAIWEEIPETVYTITYNMNGATFPEENPLHYKSSDPDIRLVNPEKTGYTFKGWKLNENEPKINIVIVSGSEGNLSFTAVWEANVYTITFNADAGRVDPAFKQVRYQSQVGTIPTPEREGYIFKGWRIGGVNGEVLTNELVYTYLEDITVVAVWEEIIIPEYDITYTLNGGELSGQNPIKYKSNDEDITLINPEKTGYTFKGWKLGDEEPKINTVIEKGTSGDLHFTAVWTAKTYRINFNANGGSVSKEYVVVTFDANIPELPTPERKGYIFKGWKKDAENGESVVQGVVYKNAFDINVVATWEEKPVIDYVITYDTDGAELPDGNPKTYKSSDADILLINPEKPGYVFLGWKTADNPEPNTQTIIKSGTEGALHFTAVWQRVKVRIVYELYCVTASGKTVTSKVNGQSALAPVEVEYGTAIAPYLYDFTPDTGYRDKKWVSNNGIEEVAINSSLTLTTENFSYMALVKESGKDPVYEFKLIARVYSTYKVTIQTYAFVYNERIQISYNGQTEDVTFIVDYNESLGNLLVNPTISAKDQDSGIYFKNWYYLKEGVKIPVTSQTIFNSTTFAGEEIVIIPQLYSYWTPIIP